MKTLLSKKLFAFIVVMVMFSAGANAQINSPSGSSSQASIGDGNHVDLGCWGCPLGYYCSGSHCWPICPNPCPPGYSCQFGVCKLIPVTYNCDCSRGNYGCSTSECKQYCKSYCGQHRNGIEEDVYPSLITIYPNPVSTSTTISFSLEQSQRVSLSVFDLNGRLVKTLADGEMKEGEHTIEWNASDLNAGIYFLQFQSGEFSKMEKLVVTK
jgi:hypothetical protein